jgi:hypothetical protein
MCPDVEHQQTRAGARAASGLHEEKGRMDRRELIKTLTAGACLPEALLARLGVEPGAAAAFESEWERWRDMLWVGPDYWGNRLHDWRLRGGEVECTVCSHNRTLHRLTQRLGPAPEPFAMEVTVRLLAPAGAAGATSYLGFRLGAKGRFADYRSAAVFGEGLDAGITTSGRLFVGDRQGADRVPLDLPVRLRLAARPDQEGFEITLQVLDEVTDRELSSLRVASALPCAGLAAILCRSETARGGCEPSARFRRSPRRSRRPCASA